MNVPTLGLCSHAGLWRTATEKSGCAEKNHSYKQVFKYLSKYKKVRIKEGGDWLDITMLKYIEDVIQKLDV